MTGFSTAEYRSRIAKITKYIQNSGKDGFLVINPYNVFYLGLYFYPGKRPLGVYISKNGTVTAFTPRMEQHEAEKISHFDRVIAYDDDYSGKSDFFSLLKKNILPAGDILADEVGLSAYNRLQSIFASLEISDHIYTLRAVKSPEEVEMLRLSGVYSDYMVECGKEMLKPGVTELGLLNRMITKTVDKMIAEMGDVIYVPGGPAGALVPSGLRTALPHALPSGKTVEAGDPMILSTGSNVWGYRTESERTFFVGEPTKEMLDAFSVMYEAQKLAITLMKPGTRCCDVEKQTCDFIINAGYGKYIRHRTGHGKGLEEHEPPFIADGDETVIESGMIFSSEPGIYIEGVAGVRHSDIVLVTEQGGVTLTNYPKDIESMIVAF